MVYLADAADNTKSPISARLNPAPAAVPLTATMSGGSIRVSREIAACKGTVTSFR